MPLSFRLPLLCTAAAILSACSTVSVTTDYDHATVFTNYKSYDLATAPDQLPLSPTSEAALDDTLRGAMAQRGIREVASGADLNVVSHAFTKDKINVYPAAGWGYGVPYRYGRYGMWMGAPVGYTDVTQYTQGTLILDFVDAKTKKLVFRGVATDTVGTPEQNAENIQEAVRKIMHDFPVPVVAAH